MCGIAGIAALAPDPRFLAIGERMAAAIAHRGPDSRGVQDLGACVLANTRLAIVDLTEQGHQPMCNEDATVWIAYNGECYNADELRPGLQRRGHRFRSRTDTEVILHLYEECGEACVGQLRGMFAFAIWDARRKQLLLARDRLGIKPLYYSFPSGNIVFASEIKALLESGLVPRKLDPDGVRAYLRLGHIPPPWTAVQDVRPLEPGELGIWHAGTWKTRSYWKLPRPTNHSPQKSGGEISARLREILQESCRVQLMSDVPIALFLSGGVDSAVLGALVRSSGPQPLTALTIAFDEKPFDETVESRQTAELLGIPHQVIPMPASRTADCLDHTIWAIDQPSVDGLNAYWISRAAREAGFKVALTGQGGDELFGGYESGKWFRRLDRTARLLQWAPPAVGRAILDWQPLPFRWRKLSGLVGADDPFVAAQIAVRELFLRADADHLMGPALERSHADDEVGNLIQEWSRQASGLTLEERVAFLDIPLHLESRLLHDGDMMSMAHSLEVRPPFLDHTIVEFVMELPISLRLSKKRLLLEAARDFLPVPLYSALLGRPKQTFTFPFNQWIAGPLRPAIEDTFQAKNLVSTGVLNPSAVKTVWRRYLKHPQSVGWSRIWTLFVLARWCQLMRVGA